MQLTRFGPVEAIGEDPGFKDAFEDHEYRTVNAFMKKGRVPPILTFTLKHPDYKNPELMALMVNMDDDQRKGMMFEHLIPFLAKMDSEYVIFGCEAWKVKVPLGEEDLPIVRPAANENRTEVLMIEGVNKEGEQLFKSWNIHPETRQLLARKNDKEQDTKNSRLASNFLGIEQKEHGGFTEPAMDNWLPS